MSLVSVRNLRKAFGDHVVLHEVNLDVAEGSVTVLIGPSGSGKTTLLRCLNGLSHPQAGIVTVDDVTVDFAAGPGRDQLAALRAQSGMVFQAHHLFPHRTALENITEGPIHVQKEPTAQARERGRALL
ncbi:MAG: amino acid ABC transporter ATP-binding protein, partial [Actinobacteria bacterium]|nr:amino acid ABC transporter ATP-binding protein [Actinomycetota bacterium]